MSILDVLLTVFATAKDITPRTQASLASVLTSIKEPRPDVARIIAQIRAEPDKEKRRALKAGLPAVVFAAQLNHRKAGDHPDKEIIRTGLVCLDFDGLWSPEESRASLMTDNRVLACFYSPSGDGLKVLCKTDDPMEDTWQVMADYFLERHEIRADKSCKDVYRLCYASHDPTLYVAEDLDGVIPFIGPREGAKQPQRRLTTGSDVLSDFVDPKAAVPPLHAISPDCEYGQWIEVGQALHCQFRGSQQGFDLWNTWSMGSAKYQGTEDLEKHYRSFNGQGMTFRTILKYAMDAGWTLPGAPKLKVPTQPAAAAKQDDLRDLLQAEISGTYSLAPWPFPSLTQHSRSLMPGSVTIICGAPGGAKSWWVITCLRYWVETGTKAAVLMLEETKAWHLKRLLAQMAGNVNLLDSSWCRSHPDLVNLAYAQHKVAIDAVSAHLQCDGNLTLQACAEWVEGQCKLGARVIVIDPITLAHPGKDKSWDADHKFMIRVKVAIESTGASLVVVSHPRKQSGGKPVPPTMDDMAGGAAFSRAAASLLWLRGIETPTEQSVITADGRQQVSLVHKIMRIMKARNATGQHVDVCYQFRDLQFIEVGSAGNVPVAPVPKSTRPTRTARLAEKPRDDEDRFS